METEIEVGGEVKGKRFIVSQQFKITLCSYRCYTWLVIHNKESSIRFYNKCTNL